MKILEYILYFVILYLIFRIVSNDYLSTEHLKKEIITNSKVGHNNLQIGKYTFVSINNEQCDNIENQKCNKLYLQDPDGSKFLFRETLSKDVEIKS